MLEDNSVLLFKTDGPLEPRAIKVGLSNWRYTEVLEGLSEDDEVVTSLGRDGVKAGALAVRE